MVDEISGPEAIRKTRELWRRSQIVKAATNLMATQGFQGMSIATLASEAGISVGTIYQYVESKEDILSLVLVDILETYRAEVPRAIEGIDDPIERLAAGFRAYCKVVDEHQPGALLAYSESRTLKPEGRRQLMDLELETRGPLTEALETATEAGLLADGVDTDTVSYDLIMLAHMWALKRWHFGKMGIDNYVAAQQRIMLRAILKPEVCDRYRHLMGGDQVEKAPVNDRRRRDGASRQRRS